MKKITEIVKDNKVEIALYGTALFWIVENIVTGTICREYDKGGSLKTLRAYMPFSFCAKITCPIMKE